MRRLLALAAVFVVGGYGSVADAQPGVGSFAAPAKRSLREPIGPRGVDELDLPRRAARQSHRAFEHRSRHFVVTSAGSAAEAKLAARELEAVWEEIGAMADYWTDVHREATFAIGAVGVWLSNDSWQTRGVVDTGPANQFVDFYLQTPANPTGNTNELDPTVREDLRRQAWRSFLRVANLEGVWPAWIEGGMGEYFARSDAGFDGTSDGASRVASNRPTPSDDDWVSYLLTGNDGREAATLLTWMERAAERAEVAHYRTDRSRAPLSLMPATFENGSPTTIAGVNSSRRFAAWRGDGRFGLPEVSLPEGMTSRDGAEAMGEHVERMVFLIRLAMRTAGVDRVAGGGNRVEEAAKTTVRVTTFEDGEATITSLESSPSPPPVEEEPQARDEPVRPGARIFEFDRESSTTIDVTDQTVALEEERPTEVDTTDESGSSDVRKVGEESRVAASPSRHFNASTLYRYVTAPTRQRWAILDPSGRLLAWRDQERLAALVFAQGVDYEIEVVGSSATVRYRTDQGETFRARMLPTADVRRPQRIEIEKLDAPKIHPATGSLDPDSRLLR